VAVNLDQRREPDRRKEARGGRRPADKAGFAPLVLVADEDAESGAMSEVILAKLRFAVARVDSVDEAITVLSTLHPDVIVARAKDLSALQRAAWPSGVPFVAVTDEMREPEALVDAIRQAIRAERTRQH
jgi:CheY-like chemotaxis protein